MATNLDVIREARKLVGCAKFFHRGRSVNYVDCIGLLVVAMRNAGIPDPPDADRYGDGIVVGDAMMGLLRAKLVEIPVSDAGPGDVLVRARVTRNEEHAHHVYLITERGTVIYAKPRPLPGSVVEHPKNAETIPSIAGAFRLPGVWYG
jgi:hypothetical protein